jgi:hypothetical protein
LLRVQKGVNKGLKGHLLQVKRALVASRLVVFIKLVCEKKRTKEGGGLGLSMEIVKKKMSSAIMPNPLL